MKTNNKQLPKATEAQVKEYHELKNKLHEFCDTEKVEDANVIQEKIDELEKQYDWFNFEFTDPTTGKKGMKDVAGETVVPALYDGFKEYRSYLHAPHAPVIAVKDGKCGIVAGDGSGQVHCEFKYDDIRTLLYTSLYLARWGGEKKLFGIIAFDGDIVCPNILTSCNEVQCGLVLIKSNDKYGLLDVESYQCVLPEYDDIEVVDLADGHVIFHKNGHKGYVTIETGEFITIEQYENEEKYGDFTPIYSHSEWRIYI